MRTSFCHPEAKPKDLRFFASLRMTLWVFFFSSNFLFAASDSDTAPLTIQLESTAFSNGKEIPAVYTCEGKNVSPPLSWEGVPGDAQSLILIMSDPDAPSGTWIHWVLFNIPPVLDMLPERLPSLKKLFNGERHGRNSAGNLGYTGPCPPSGTHRYFFHLYALDNMPRFDAGATADELKEAMKGHVLARGEFMGTYQKTASA